ncbi:MAG: Bacterial alpha-L-rhamnosidase [Candidatus Marinimicrobia bacterium]|nr:Bacterial alpha-L-rhamnosidase [Candidatus Neomarinimicrobiota bacterium]
MENVRDTHFYTGILGTKALINILPEYGFSDLLFQMTIEPTYPGYGFWIENNATTLWEFWSGLDSHNHAMFGTIDEFFYNDLAGIKAPVQRGTDLGYSHILIEPVFLDELTDAGASIETVRGTVSSVWERTADGISYAVTIPVNATATVRIPVNDAEDVTLTEGDDLVWQRDVFYDGLPGISSGEMDREHLTLEIGSGEYLFTVSHE